MTLLQCCRDEVLLISWNGDDKDVADDDDDDEDDDDNDLDDEWDVHCWF